MKSSIALLLACALPAVAAPLPKPLAGFLDKHCVDCHDKAEAKGGLNIADLTFEPTKPANFEKWQRIFERTRDNEMPPAKKARPKKTALHSFLVGLRTPLVTTDLAAIAAEGRVHSRRLTRVEYEHTMHDLLGIEIPLEDLLPEDPSSSGFETVAKGQQLSYHQLSRYLDVADLALGEAFSRALKGDAVFKKQFTPEDLARKTPGNYRGPDLRNGESISWPITLQFFGRMPATEVRADGWYRVTLRGVRSINEPKDGAVWGTLRSGTCSSSSPMLHMIGLVEATPTPRDLVFEAWIQKGNMLELKPNDAELRIAPTGATGGNVSFAERDLAKDGFAGIAHRGIEMERIYRQADRETVRRNLFGDVNPEDAKADPAALDRLLAQFAARAFRRPVTPAQLTPYLEIGRATLKEGKPLAEALRAGYRAMLCSPRFLTFIEAPGALDAHAVAARLSYALWVSMPDAQLTRLADERKLKQPQVLAAQIERMLADAKSERFIRSFTDQWLKLKEIDFTSPDSRLYRTFDPVVQESMVQETRAFVRELIRKNLGITNVVDSDFTFLTGRLARHYQKAGEGQTFQKGGNGKNGGKKAPAPVAAASSPAPKITLTPGQGLQKVVLPAGLPRGGLLTQGAILKVTADGATTSPVIRGVFVNERILGQHIAPPPPGTPAIEPDIRGAVSIRDQLDKHRDNASCTACHKMIDPPGFVLENFDPIGGWRTRYGGSSKGAAVDPAGVTADGREFADLEEWKAIYKERGPLLAKNFVSQFLTYSTGAKMRFSDEAVVEGIVAKTKVSNYGARALLTGALTSPIFLKK